MIYIIEGGEGTGKTTLANFISKHTGYPIKHRSNPKTEEERKNMYASYIEGIRSGENMIWDRSFYSEMVYGPIMRDQSYITYAQMLEFEVELSKVGAIVIYCYDDPRAAWKRAQNRGEEYIKEYDKHLLIMGKYDDLFINNAHVTPILLYQIKDALMKGIEDLCK